MMVQWCFLITCALHSEILLHSPHLQSLYFYVIYKKKKSQLHSLCVLERLPVLVSSRLLQGLLQCPRPDRPETRCPSPHRRCVPPAADLEGAGGNTPLHFLPAHSSRPSSPAAPSCSTLRSSVPSSAASELLPQQPAGSFFTAVNLACHHMCPPATSRVRHCSRGPLGGLRQLPGPSSFSSMGHCGS